MKNVAKYMVGCLLSCVCMANAASSFTWQGSSIKDIDTSVLSATLDGSYTFLLGKDNNTSIGFNVGSQTAGAGESLLYSDTFANINDGNGAFNAGLPDPSQINIGDYVYSVILDNTQGSATFYSILEGSSHLLTAGEFPAGDGTYTAPGNNSWVAVPEPTTMALLGVGAVVMAVRRRSKK